jgi:peptide/nickel transport system permease protein
MLSYLLRRMLTVAPTMLVVTVIVFALIRAIPGDPVLVMLGEDTPGGVADELRRRLGLDQPYPLQFWYWLSSIAQGDLGRSIVTEQRVGEALLAAFPVTAQVVLIATVIAALIAIPGGMLAAWRQNSAADMGVVFAATLCLSVPSFWVGLMLLLLFGVKLGWLPTVGYVSITEDLGRGLLYLLMPVMALVLTEVATLTRMTRASVIEVLRLEYIVHARAKGLSEGAVLWRHAFRNAFAPTLTVLGLILGHLLGGIVVLETVFSLPGLGRLLVESIFRRDYPVVQGCLLFISGLTILVNLLVDLVYPWLDPRVRL